MKLYVLAIRDAKSEVFGRPICVNAIGQGMRSFEDEVNRAHEENVMFHHPEDFGIWQLGTYDDATGELISETPKLLAQGMEVKKSLPKHISKV